MIDGRAIFDRIQEARGDREKDGSGDNDVLEAANEGDDAGRGDQNDNLDENEREELDTGLCGRIVVHGLKGEREIVDGAHEGTEQAEEEYRGATMLSASIICTLQGKDCQMQRQIDSRNSATLEQVHLEHCLVPQPFLPQNKDHGQHADKHQARNDRSVIPGLLDAAPLKSKDDAAAPSHRQRTADPVALGHFPDHFARIALVGCRLTEGRDSGLDDGLQDESRATERQVDLSCQLWGGRNGGTKAELETYIEAPPPGQVRVCKGAADQRSDDGCQRKAYAKQAKVLRPVVQGRDFGNDDHGAAKDTGSTDASDGAAQDEDVDRWGHAADE